MRITKLILLWLLYFIPSLVIELMCYMLAPVVALFVRSEVAHDYSKRLGGMVYVSRDYLIKPLYWFQTHDNAVDEWWHGKYNENHWFRFARVATQANYDTKAWFRYYCRVMWLWRNCGYGFLYNLLGMDLKDSDGDLVAWIFKEHGQENSGKFWWCFTDRWTSFQLEAQIPLYGVRHISINVGHKTHKGKPRTLYANRIIGFRKYKL